MVSQYETTIEAVHSAARTEKQKSKGTGKGTYKVVPQLVNMS